MIGEQVPPPPGAEPPVEPTPPSRGPSRGVLLGAAALIAVGLVLAALLLRSTGTDETTAAGEETTTSSVESTASTEPGETTTTQPGQSTTTSPALDPAEVDAVITDLMAFVEVERGLDFEERPNVELLDPTEFANRLNAQVTDEELQAQAERLSQLGLLPPGADPVAEFREALTARVAGWYDPTSGSLVVRNAQLDQDARQILVHELVHALDDQHFDLDRPEYLDLPDETAFGFRALVEGDARRIERIYRDRLNPDNPDPPAELPDLSEQDPYDYGEIVGDMLDAPYLYGERMVLALLDYRDERGVNAAFSDPPTTSEQVVHWDRYLVREERIDVPPPPAEGEVTDEGVLGELMLEAMLEAKIGRSAAVEAASGWGGDWYVQYSSEDLTCLRVDWQMDSSGDLTELVTAFEDWVDAGGIGQIEQPDEDTLRFTNCVPPAGGGGGESPL